MVATAERIDFIRHSATFGGVTPPLSASTLTVDFRVFRRGPAHVCGLIYTTDNGEVDHRDFWVTREVALASFKQFEGDFEVWQAVVSVGGHGMVGFEYVIFCDDHRGEREIKKYSIPTMGRRFVLLRHRYLHPSQGQDSLSLVPIDCKGMELIGRNGLEAMGFGASGWGDHPHPLALSALTL